MACARSTVYAYRVVRSDSHDSYFEQPDIFSVSCHISRLPATIMLGRLATWGIKPSMLVGPTCQMRLGLTRLRDSSSPSQPQL
jgi:hypothetical protein